MGGHRPREGSSRLRWLTAIALGAALTVLFATSADAFVFWANRDSETIGRAKTNGKGVDQTYIKVRTSAYGVAVDAGHVYWTDRKGGRIGRASRDGTAVKRKLVTSLSSPHGIAVDDHYMYWANSGTDSIGRAALDGSGVDPGFIPDAKGAGMSRWMVITCIGPTPRGSAARISMAPAPIRASSRRRPMASPSTAATSTGRFSGTAQLAAA